MAGIFTYTLAKLTGTKLVKFKPEEMSAPCDKRTLGPKMIDEKILPRPIEYICRGAKWDHTGNEEDKRRSL